MTMLARNIAQIRRRKGMSQAEFAGAVGATRAQVSNWERGRTLPDFRHLRALASLASIDVERLHDQELPYHSQPAPATAGADIAQELARLHSRLDDLENLIRNLLPRD